MIKGLERHRTCILILAKEQLAFVLNQFKSVLNQFKSRSKFAESYKILPTKLKAIPPLSLPLTRYTRRQQSDL